MSLTPIRPSRLRRLLPLTPTRDQLGAFWGRNTSRQGKVFEAIGVATLFLWVGFFISRTVLGPPAGWAVAWIACAHLLASPLLWANRKNATIRAKGRRGALMAGRVDKVGQVIVPRPHDHPLMFRMLVSDEEGLDLVYEVPMARAYREIEPGMRCYCIVLSDDRDFEEVAAISDAYIPALQMWVGSYPYLNKESFLRMLRRRLKRLKGQRREREQLHL
ncbi:unnamed protein product [Chrysoparadoxa australica]